MTSTLFRLGNEPAAHQPYWASRASTLLELCNEIEMGTKLEFNHSLLIVPFEVPSSLSNAYDSDSPARVIIYGPSQFGWNLLCSQKLFLGLGPLAETFRVSPVCCIIFLECGDTMLSAQPLLHAVRLPCLGL